MIRLGFVMRVHPDAHVEYQRRHDALWPEAAGFVVAQGMTGQAQAA